MLDFAELRCHKIGTVPNGRSTAAPDEVFSRWVGESLTAVKPPRPARTGRPSCEGITRCLRGGDHFVQPAHLKRVNGPLRHIEVLRLLIEKSPSRPGFGNHLQYPINSRNQFARAD